MHWRSEFDKYNKRACKARFVPLQAMDLQVKSHYYTMGTLWDMDLKQELNQSVTDVSTYKLTDKGNTICVVHICDGT